MPKIRPFITKGVENVIPVLEAVNAASDVFPPLKSAVAGALHILRIFKDYDSNQNDWKDFADYVAQAVACVSVVISQTRQPSLFTSALENLQLVLAEILSTIDTVPELEAKTKGFKKIGKYHSFIKDPEKIPDLEAKLDRALAIFNLSTTINAHNYLSTTFSNVCEIVAGIRDMKEPVNSVDQGQQKLNLDAAVRQLRCADHSSFDSQRACYPGTRPELMAELENFTSNMEPSSPHRVLLLTGVAGCGKTAIAQSAAKLFDHSEWTRPRLGACFNFSAQIEERRTAKLLFSTIAFALSALHPDLKSSIAGALLDRPTLASSASSADQFHDLVEVPLRAFLASFSCRIVMVIDALDEIDQLELVPLLDILANDFSRLPASCRVIVTSRPNPEILHRLEFTEHGHVVLHNIAHRDWASQRDIRLVASVKLRDIATRRRLGVSWPGSESEKKLVSKAGGLFVWLDVACKAVLGSPDPAYELERLLEGDATEPDMDLLYRKILDACWSRKGFMSNYHLVVGTILSLKAPLSASAVQHFTNSLLKGVSSRANDVLEPLASVILNVPSSVSPALPHRRLEISHESFRAFAMRRAIDAVPEDQRIYLIDEFEASQRLVLRCLRVIKDELPQHSDTLKALFPASGDGGIILHLDDDVVSEALGYACDHWMAHLPTVMKPETGLIDALLHFLRKDLVLWIQLCTSRGKIQEIGAFQQWLAKNYHSIHIDFAIETNLELLCRCLDQIDASMTHVGRLEDALAACWLWVEVERRFKEDGLAPPTATLAKALRRLSICLAGLGRLEEALISSQKAVGIHRQLADEKSAKTYTDLAVSLTILSCHWWAAGKGEEALSNVEEAVNIYRTLTVEQPLSFDADLSQSLHTLSACLSSLGCREEALSVIQEAVDIRRRLAAERPSAFDSKVADSLHSLSVKLSSLGRHEEALSTIQESVIIRRQLAAAQPAAYNSDLASSLHNLSANLSALGRHEEALSVDEEAVAIRRLLAEERPAVYDPGLASSLHSLSVDLSAHGRHEEALQVIREAVGIRRRLAAAQPAAYNPHLASSLHSLSADLSNLAHREEALSIIQESVSIRRQLAAERPAVFNPDLARSLHNLSAELSAVGLHEQALSVDEEATRIRRQLAVERPATFLPDLASSLHNLSADFSAVGRHEEALSVIREVVSVRRRLATERPTQFTSDLAVSLYNLSIELSTLGRGEGALKAIDEAVPLYRQLAAKIPAVYASELGDALNLLAYCLAEVGKDDEATTARKEAETLS